MGKNQTSAIKSNKRLFCILLGVMLLLFIPLIAMQFSTNVKWTSFDFIVAAILLLITALTLELILRKVKVTKFRIMACVGIFLVFLLIWAELAVGIFGTPFAGH